MLAYRLLNALADSAGSGHRTVWTRDEYLVAKLSTTPQDLETALAELRGRGIIADVADEEMPEPLRGNPYTRRITAPADWR
ncbi:hypothetical protein ACWDTT_10485 [Streptosporangium sandarakinum]